MTKADSPRRFHLLRFERHHQPMPPLAHFLGRLLLYFAMSNLLVAGSLGIGMLGYRHFEGMSWLDAFLNASMIMSGMGPAQSLSSSAGKLFAGCYALYAGLVLVTAVGLLAAPLFHRLLHRFHLADGA